jgi:hypothetical protein
MVFLLMKEIMDIYKGRKEYRIKMIKMWEKEERIIHIYKKLCNLSCSLLLMLPKY